MLSFLTWVASIAYPAFQTYKAASPRGSPEDRHLLLCYWCVWAVLSYAALPVADVLLGWLGSLYALAKLALFLWLVLPTTRGAAVVLGTLEGRQLSVAVANPQVNAVLQKTASSLSTLRARGEEELRGLAQRANAWVAAQNAGMAGGAGGAGAAPGSGADHHHPSASPAAEDGAHPL